MIIVTGGFLLENYGVTIKMAGDKARYQSQIYLTLPENLPESFGELLEQALGAGSVASVMMRVTSAKGNEALGAELCKLSQDHGAAFLLGVDADNLGQGQDFLKRWQADGLHLFDSTMPVKAIRKQVGPDKIVGSFCGLSRHQAMLAGEGGADYIAVGHEGERNLDGVIKSAREEFDHILVFLKWYLEVFELPVVVWDCGSYEDVGRLVAGGADFVAVNDLVWQAGQRAGPTMEYVLKLAGHE